jgi:WhiB family transcriptional regulator, redox-sensing transcriptional regulator
LINKIGAFQAAEPSPGIRGLFVCPPPTIEQGREVTDLMMLASVLDDALVTDEVIPCRTDPELWFAESPADVEQAKDLCRVCPVRMQCLAGARARREPWGVWGGELFDSGVVVPRKRPRGRPRKTELAA